MVQNAVLYKVHISHFSQPLNPSSPHPFISSYSDPITKINYEIVKIVKIYCSPYLIPNRTLLSRFGFCFDFVDILKQKVRIFLFRWVQVGLNFKLCYSKLHKVQSGIKMVLLDCDFISDLGNSAVSCLPRSLTPRCPANQMSDSQGHDDHRAV